MRVVFAGTPLQAVPSLQALLDSAHEVAAVVTRPQARSGRGRKAAVSPIEALAADAGIDVLTPAHPSDPDFIAQIRDIAPDAAPVVAYGGLIPPQLLDIPTYGWINLHFSLLPAWRGAAPVQRAVMAGDDVTGACTFRLEKGLDTGPIFGEITQAVGPRDTAGDLLDRLANAGAGLLVKTLDAIEEGAQPTPQPEDGVSLAPKILVEDVEIDWSHDAGGVDRLIRGASPAPGAWTTFRGERLKVLRSVLTENTATGEPGSLRATKKQVFAIAGSTTDAGGRHEIELLEVQPQGKKAMLAADWARGVRVNEGDRLGL